MGDVGRMIGQPPCQHDGCWKEWYTDIFLIPHFYKHNIYRCLEEEE